jgi:pimeloyl-ACP methyl ester carboxylesterase
LADARPTVVLLHGLGRTHRSMTGLRQHIEGLGYATWSQSYPSRRAKIQDLAAEMAARIRGDLGDTPLVGVTHSMGGILVRYMGELPWRGVVMLAPPNRGSLVAAELARRRLYRWYLGPAGRDLAEGDGFPAPPRPFAVIAGTRGVTLGNLPSWFIAGMRLLPRGAAHDGTVLVSETRLEGMVGFAEVDASHTFLMNHPEARALVARFLARSRF